MNVVSIRIEGGLLSPDFLERIHEMPGQRPADFGLDSNRPLVDETTAIYADARVYWDAFQRRRTHSSTESVTSITREQWVIPLLELLGYKLAFQRKAAEADGKSYAISHRASADDTGPPVHIVGADQELGSRPPSGRGTMSPHALVQDYLNRTDNLWGVVTNGHVLRLLRDSTYFTRPSYIEFDLRQMMQGEQLDEFILLYRLAHRSRLPQTTADAPHCLLEGYHQHALDQGGRIRDGLRNAVEQAIRIFGNGFLRHSRNEALRQAIRDQQLTPRRFYQQLLYLIYRLLFLMVAEERGLLVSRQNQTAGDFYRAHLSLARLRVLADEPLSAPERFDDLFLALHTLFHVLHDEKLAGQLALPPLNGKLFDPLPHIDPARLNNRDLLNAIRSLSWFVPAEERVPRRINYAALDVEELGSVYESLLELQPVFTETEGRPAFDFAHGTERKSTGSYYTAPELVGELIQSALVPVIEERLKAAKTTADKIKGLLSLKICDMACGSGHFLLAAARRLGKELAILRTGQDEPAPEDIRSAIREVITHCIYGVDKNPLAVDLCKVALWIEGHAEGKPLTFLDHRIRCGDSLVGVFDLNVLKAGIPDEAFNPVSGDDKPTARELKRRNHDERSGQMHLPFDPAAALHQIADSAHQLAAIPDDSPEAVRRKEQLFDTIRRSPLAIRQRTACNLWTAAFFAQLTPEARNARHVPTTDDLRRCLENPNSLDARLTGHANALARQLCFFHWPLEFPDVFEQGGFDVMLGNPPWERIKLQEQEFFATRDPQIAAAPNKAARQRLIDALPQNNPAMAREFADAKHAAEAGSKFVRASDRFPLTAVGDINTYALFAELSRRLLNPQGRAGIIVPTGIATDDTCKAFFADLNDHRALASLYDFENREALFPAVDSRMKFCLLTTSGKPTERGDFAFFCTRADHLRDEQRRFALAPEDLALLNPNTRTCPIFRTRADAELTKKIYRCVPVLVNEQTGENPWGVRFMTMFHMANDSGLFQTAGDEGLLPLYEAKMIWHFDHRWATYDGNDTRDCTEAEKQDPHFTVRPRYWVASEEVETGLGDWKPRWLLGFRDITNATNERTAILSLLPRVGVGHTAPLTFLSQAGDHSMIACLLACTNSLPFDYVARQKMGGIHMTYTILNQLPVLPPSAYTESDRAFIVPRVVELVYTAWDLQPFAADILAEIGPATWNRWFPENPVRIASSEKGDRGSSNPQLATSPLAISPFLWQEERRAVLRAELDAYYARLYGLTRDELRYILDPKDVYGENFPGETFRVLKEKELAKYGEYRTRRLVLEAWERLTT
jgi:hypothetical protein